MDRGGIEVALAAIAPAVVALVVARRLGDDATRRATVRWFVPLVLLWLAPCWLTGRSPVAWGFLHESVAPWSALPEAGPKGATHLSDVPMQFAPWRETVTRRWLSGEMPFLDRHAASGSALWANPQAIVLHPLTLLGLPFSTFAWFVFVAAAKLLTGLLGMFAFLRREGLGERGALTGALAWGFGAFSIAWLLFPHTNVTMLLPWLLVAIRGAIDGRSWRGAGGGAIVLALMCAGGHPESVAHCAFVALPYAGARLLRHDAEGRRGALLRIGAIGVAGLLLAAPLLVPFALSLGDSERLARWERMPRFWTAPPMSAANLVPFVNAATALHGEGRPNFNESATQYAGVVVLALAIWHAVRRWRDERLWIALFAVAAILAFDWPPGRLLESIPLAGHMLHGRLRFVLLFVVATLAAKGVDELATAVSRRGAIVAIALSAAASAASVAFAWNELAAAGIASIVALAAAAGASIVLQRRPEHFAVIAPALVFADLFALLWLYNAPVSRDLAYPATSGVRVLAEQSGPSRVAGVDNAIVGNAAAMLRLEEIGAHDPMAWDPYLALLRRAGYDASGYFSQWTRVPPKLLLDYLGVTRLAAPPGVRIAGLEPAYAGRDLTVYRNPGALPRAFAASAVVISADPLTSFTRSGDPRAVSVAPEDGAARAAPARVRIERYDANGERVVVETEDRAFVATSEPALPGWRLERDGEAWPLVKVNGVFLGWNVPPGGGRFELCYRPPGFEAGLAMGIAGLVALAAMLRAGREPR